MISGRTSQHGNGSLHDVRNRSILALGFAGGFRRSELVGPDLEDVAETPEGFRVLVRRSKTDQTGEGMAKAIFYGAHSETCPVRLLRRWLEVTGITVGPIFVPSPRRGRCSGHGSGHGPWRTS
jgi:hypothetical protein